MFRRLSFLFGLVTLAVAGSLLLAPATAASISLSTDVLNEGNSSAARVANNASNSVGLELVRFIGNSENTVGYTQSGTSTIDVSTWVYDSGDARGSIQQLQVNGYSNTSSGSQGNMYLRGETNTNNPGFGAHANWIVTFDLNVIRDEFFAGSSDPLKLTGLFGAWGGIGSTDSTAGMIQGMIFLDGTRIDSMGETVANPPESIQHQSFDLTISSGQYLTFGIFNDDGTDPSSLWDDGVYQNVELTSVPEPSSVLLLATAFFGLAVLARRRRR